MSDLAFEYFAIRPVHPVRRLHMFLESWGAIADIGGLQFQATLSYRANRFAEDAWEFMGPLWSLFPDEYAKLKAVRWDRRDQKASRKVFSLLRLIDASLDKALLNRIHRDRWKPFEPDWEKFMFVFGVPRSFDNLVFWIHELKSRDDWRAMKPAAYSVFDYFAAFEIQAPCLILIAESPYRTLDKDWMLESLECLRDEGMFVVDTQKTLFHGYQPHVRGEYHEECKLEATFALRGLIAANPEPTRFDLDNLWESFGIAGERPMLAGREPFHISETDKNLTKLSGAFGFGYRKGRPTATWSEIAKAFNELSLPGTKTRNSEVMRSAYNQFCARNVRQKEGVKVS